MNQIWELDKNNFFTGNSYFAEEVEENMTTVPYLVGYVKGKLVNNEWVEGATEEEIQAWKDKQIDNCSNPIKTNEQLTEENQFLMACIMEMAQIVYS